MAAREMETIKLTNLPLKKGAMGKRTSRLSPAREKKPPPLPPIDELIAECRALGWDDLAKSMEKVKRIETRIKRLDTPEGQAALNGRERRLSRM